MRTIYCDAGPLPGLDCFLAHSTLAHAFLLGSVEKNGRTLAGLRALHEKWPRDNRPVIVYEHGLFSSRMVVYRLLLDMGLPANLRGVLTWGPYARARILEAGWPADRAIAVGPVLLPRVPRDADATLEFAYLPCHDDIPENARCLHWAAAAARDLGATLICKVRPGSASMPDPVISTTDMERLGRCALAISPCVQTIVAATMAAGMPTLLYRRPVAGRWPREAALDAEYEASLRAWDLPWFDDLTSLRVMVHLVLRGHVWPGVAPFLSEAVGIGIGPGAFANAVRPIFDS